MKSIKSQTQRVVIGSIVYIYISIEMGEILVISLQFLLPEFTQKPRLVGKKNKNCFIKIGAIISLGCHFLAPILKRTLFVTFKI
jgi:hypothetical protein